jgi:putative membrane protein
MKPPVLNAVLLAGVCLFAAAPAFAQSPSDRAIQPSGPAPSTQTNQVAQSAPTTEDFVKAVAISDMFEIQSSKLALEKKARPDEKFAERMVQDHTKTTEQLKELVKSGKVKAELPTALDGKHQQMLDQLRSESGATFEKDYDQMQRDGHKQAVALFESYAKGGDNAELKRWAANTLPHLQEHLALAEKLTAR